VSQLELVQYPGKNYRDEILKGRIYRCPAIMPTDSLVIVRPLCDGEKDSAKIPSDLIPYSQCHNAFNHTDFPQLKLKEDEEFILVKAKYRRVLALTGQDTSGFLRVAPIYTVKGYHSKKFSMDKLIKNEVPGIIYLPESEANEESLIPLMEAFPVYKMLLEPIRLELSIKGMTLLDDNLVLVYDLYSNSK
jgi:hypothetical protein